MKILFVTTISGTLDFLVPHMRFLMEAGHRVDAACSVEDITQIKLQDSGLRVYDIPFQRRPFRKENLAAFKKIRELAAEEKYDIMHVHTPVAAFVARLACRNLPGLKIYYTAHGFHFYSGAPLLNWVVYYPMERLASRWTDKLVTMNSEDYNRARKMTLRNNGDAFLVHGVGLDIMSVRSAKNDSPAKRKELGVEPGSFVLLSVGELIRRKNFETGIRAFAAADIPGSVYLICGRGPLKARLKRLAEKLNVADRVRFLGFREDIYEILKAADVFLFPSCQEGLPVAVMEAMAAGVPVVCSGIRGNMDLIQHKINGLVAGKRDVDGFARAVKRIRRMPEIAEKFAEKNREIIGGYSVENVLQEMASVYTAAASPAALAVRQNFLGSGHASAAGEEGLKSGIRPNFE